MQRYCKEVIVWKRAIHVNILAIEGVAENIEFSMVSPWMNDGDLLEYVKNNPRTNRLDLVRPIDVSDLIIIIDSSLTGM